MTPSKTIDLLYSLEEKVGKEEGRRIVEAFVEGLEAIEERAEALAIQKKLELKDELTKELVTKAEFYGETRLIRQEMQTIKTGLEGKIDRVKTELEGKIDRVKTELEGKIAKLDQKFNFMIVLMIIALTLMNPVAAELIKKALRI